jgi:hypothetical protein
MPSTYTTNLGIELIANGEEDGTWGTITNENFNIIDRAINGSVALTLTGTTSTLTTSDGTLTDGQYKALILGGSPSGTHTITIAPPDAQKIYFVVNGTAQSVVLTQGSGGNVTVPAGRSALVYADGGGASAAVVDFSANLVPVLSNAGVTASTAELNILDGVTSTTAELNILDGVTATAAELNVVDGADTTLAPQILAQPKGFLDPENRIINGAFDFWQRGTSFTSVVYGADRWVNQLSGGTVTMSRQAFALGDTLGTNNPTFFLRQTVSGQSASGNRAHVVHNIEGVRSYAGQTITLLGWARRSSGSGNMAVEPVQSFGTGGSPSSAVFVTPQTVTLTSSFAPFAVTIAVPSITGKTVGTDGNDYFALNFWTSAGSDFNARTNSLGLQTIGVDLWGVHIKVGTHTTAATDLYKQPELGPELARCQRYGRRFGWDNAAKFATGSTTSATSARVLVPHVVEMRAAPSLTVSGTTSNFTIIDGQGSIRTCTVSPSLLFSSALNCEIVFTVSGAVTGGAQSRLVTDASLFLDSEL